MESGKETCFVQYVLYSCSLSFCSQYCTSSIFAVRVTAIACSDLWVFVLFFLPSDCVDVQKYANLWGLVELRSVMHETELDNVYFQRNFTIWNHKGIANALCYYEDCAFVSDQPEGFRSLVIQLLFIVCFAK